MNREKLIDRLLRDVFPEWEDLDDATRQAARAGMASHLEVLLDFVAEWITQHSYNYHYGFTGDSMRTLAQVWRKEMGE